MGSDISIPMYLMSVNSSDFDHLVEAMVASLPDLETRVLPGTEISVAKAWRTHRDIAFQSSGARTDEIEALRLAFESTGLAGARADYEDFRVRLTWLERDLLMAPVCTSEPIHVRDPDWLSLIHI